MPTINISEKDFEAVACAANDADRRGCLQAAEDLDKIARKMNAALSNMSVPAAASWGAGAAHRKITWQEVPSCLARKIIAAAHASAE